MCIEMANGGKQNHTSDDVKMMSKMTDEQIKKALECIASEKDVLCKNCAYNKYYLTKCHKMTAKDALDLINRQQTAFENSMKATKHWHREAELNAKEIIKLQAEIERLKEELEIRNQKRASIFEISNAYERGRAKAIKEFAERLREFKMYVGNSQGVHITDEDIDNIVKEMVGEGK